MKRSHLYLSLCVAIAANFTTGFKTSSDFGETLMRAHQIDLPAKQAFKNILILKRSNQTQTANSNNASNVQVKLTITGTPKSAEHVYNHYQFSPYVPNSFLKSVHYTIKNKPRWLSFDAATGLLQGQPLAKHIGVYQNITISVLDTNQTATLPAFSITVRPAIDIAFKYGKAKQGTNTDYPFYSSAKNILDRNSKTYNRTRGGANAENWVQVELPHFSRIYKVVIKANNEFFRELRNADVYLSTKPYLGRLAKADRIASLKGVAEEQTITLKKGKQASYLIIKGKNDSGNRKQLSLAEVRAFGETPKSPVFKTHNKHFLLDKSAKIGYQVVKLEAKDYQDDTLYYHIKGKVPFIINTDGSIKVSGALIKHAYRFKVVVSDGVNETSTNISVKISTQQNLQRALKQGDETLVTVEQLYQEINKTYKASLKQCIERSGSDAALSDCQLNNPYTAIVRTVNHLENEQLQFDYQADDACSATLGKIICDDKLLINSVGENLGFAFMQGAKELKKQLTALDEKGHSVFKQENTDKLLKLFVLLGDKYRQAIHYPMDKITTNSLTFYQALFADYAVHYARSGNNYQPDLGDYSSKPERLNHKRVISKTITLKPSKYDEWSSALLYAAPGKPLKIKRTDKSDNEVWMRVSMLRQGSSRIWNPLQYTRPQFIRSHAVKLEQGRSYNFSTPYGGPIMIWSKGVDKNPKSFSVMFKGVIQNPVLSVFDQQHISDFVDTLDHTDFNWVDIKTPFLELHSLTSKIKEAFNHAGSFPYNGNASKYLEELKRYLIINNLNLAGFSGEGLTLNERVKAWCESQSFDCESNLHSKPSLQHINSDVQAHCGSGCSGNPYDATWPILPVAWGDNHEFGHNLQTNRLKIYGHKSLEVSNNIFPLFSNWQYLNDKGLAVHPNLSRPSTRHAFEMIYDGFKQGVKPSSKHSLWKNEGVYAEAAERLVFYQQLVFVHQSWDIYTKLYLIDRLLTGALASDEKWQTNKQRLGFSNYTKAEAQALNGNDFMAIVLSNITQQDHRNYFSMWGVKINSKAQQQIISNGFLSSVPRVFYPVNQDKLTAVLPRKKVDLDEPEIYHLMLKSNCSHSQGCAEVEARITIENPENDTIYFVSKYADNGVTQATKRSAKAYSIIKVKAVNVAGKHTIINFRAAKSFLNKGEEAVSNDGVSNKIAMNNNSARSNAEKVAFVIWRNPEDNKHLVAGETYTIIETPIIQIMKGLTPVGQVIVSINDLK